MLTSSRLSPSIADRRPWAWQVRRPLEPPGRIAQSLVLHGERGALQRDGTRDRGIRRPSAQRPGGQQPGRTRLHRPARYEQASRSGVDERPAQPREGLRAAAVPARGVARRQHGPVGVELKSEDLSHGQQPVALGARQRGRGQGQRRLRQAVEVARLAHVAHLPAAPLSRHGAPTNSSGG